MYMYICMYVCHMPQQCTHGDQRTSSRVNSLFPAGHGNQTRLIKLTVMFLHPTELSQQLKPYHFHQENIP